MILYIENSKESTKKSTRHSKQILPKAIYSFNAFSIKFQWFGGKNQKANPQKIHMELWGTPCSQTILKKKNKVRGLTFPNFETYSKATLTSRLGRQNLRLGKDQGDSLFQRGLSTPQHFLILSMLMLAAVLLPTGDIYCSTLLCRKNEMATEKFREAGWSQGLARWWRRAGVSALWDFPPLYSKGYGHGIGECHNQKGP